MGPGQVARERVARHELSGRKPRIEHEARSEPEKPDQINLTNERCRRAAPECHKGGAPDGLHQTDQSHLRAHGGVFLQSEATQDRLRSERLDELRVEIRAPLHQLALVEPVAAVNQPIDKHVDRDESEREQRELPRPEEHRTQRENEDERIERQAQQGAVEEVPDLDRIAHPRSDLAHAHRVEKRLRQPQQMPVVGEHEGDIDPLRHAEGQQRLEPAQHQFETEDREHRHAEQVQESPVAVGDNVVHDLLDVDCHRQAEHGRDDRTDEGLKEHRLVRLEEVPQPLPLRDRVVARLKTIAGSHQYEHAGPDGFEFLVRPLLHAANSRVHHLGVFWRPLNEDDIVQELPVDQAMGNRGQRHHRQRLHRTLDALRCETQLPRRLHHTQCGRAFLIRARQLPQPGDGENLTIVRRHRRKARRAAVGDVTLFKIAWHRGNATRASKLVGEQHDAERQKITNCMRQSCDPDRPSRRNNLTGQEYSGHNEECPAAENPPTGGGKMQNPENQTASQADPNIRSHCLSD